MIYRIVYTLTWIRIGLEIRGDKARGMQMENDKGNGLHHAVSVRYLHSAGSPQFLPLSAYGGLTCLDLRVCKINLFIFPYSRRPIGLILCEPKTLHITSCFPKYGAPGPWKFEVSGQIYFFLFFIFRQVNPPYLKVRGFNSGSASAAIKPYPPYPYPLLGGF